MRKQILILSALWLLSGAAHAAGTSLLQNEYNFARDVDKRGVRDGFLLYLDKQAITFAPQPLNAYNFYQGRKPGSSKLSWYPVFARESASGDFGVDTGPWQADYNDKDGKPQQAHGEWLTVWAKDKSGNWRALFDAGVEHDAPPAPVKALAEDAKVSRLPSWAGTPASMQDVYDKLTRSETLFSNDAQFHNLQSAYASMATGDVHLLLEHTQPVVGKDLALKVLPATPSNLQWVPMGGSAAKSGDLGYVYGMTYKPTDTKRSAPQGVYMHVWQLSQDGWHLLVDLEQPLEP